MAETLPFLKGYRDTRMFNEELANAQTRRKLSELALQYAPEDRRFQLDTRAQTQKQWGYENQKQELTKVADWTQYALNQLGVVNNPHDYNRVLATMQKQMGLPDDYARPFIADTNMTPEQFNKFREEKLTYMSNIQNRAAKELEKFKSGLNIDEIEARNKGQMDLQGLQNQGQIGVENIRHLNDVALIDKQAALGLGQYDKTLHLSDLGKMAHEMDQLPANSPVRDQYQRVMDAMGRPLTPAQEMSHELAVEKAYNNDPSIGYKDPMSGQRIVYEGSPTLDEYKRNHGINVASESGGKKIDFSKIAPDNMQQIYDATRTDEERASVAAGLLQAGNLEGAQAFNDLIKKNETKGKKEESKKKLSELSEAPGARERKSSLETTTGDAILRAMGSYSNPYLKGRK